MSNGQKELENCLALWLDPLPGESGPCGPSMANSDALRSLEEAAQGKREDALGHRAAEPPDWGGVRAQCESLFQITRDLRVGVLWLRAIVNRNGISALAPGLFLLTGLLQRYWDTVHPLPDQEDGALYERVSALSVLGVPQGLLGDLRNAQIVDLQGFGKLRVRDAEIASGSLRPRDEDANHSKERLSQLMDAAIKQGSTVQTDVGSALQALSELVAIIDERMGSGDAPDLQLLKRMLTDIAAVLPVTVDNSQAPAALPTPGASTPQSSTQPTGQAAPGSISSRTDASRAIDLICQYLEHAEPSNPARLLLRRAQRLLHHDFLQLVKEFAPGGLGEAALVMGVDPATVKSRADEG